MTGNRRLAAALLIALGLMLLIGAGVLGARALRRPSGQMVAWPTLSPRSTWTVTATPRDTDTPTPSPSVMATRPSPTSSPAEIPTIVVAAASATGKVLSPTATPSPSAAPSATLPATATEEPPTPSPTRSPVPAITETPQAPRVRIEAIDLVAAIVPVSWHVGWTNEGAVAEWDVVEPPLVGHHQGSAGLGGTGNVVLSAHGRDGAPFAHLDQLQSGDLIMLEDAGATLVTYSVAESLMLPDLGVDHGQRLANAGYMGPTDDDRLTLITCWPSWGYTHRLVVIARKQDS